MREKYFEDLGLDDGEEIFKKFKIDVSEILGNKDEKNISDKNDKNSNKV